MMDDLVKHITQKTGMSDEQARSAMNAALEFVDARLPAPLAAQVRHVLGGSGSAAGGGGGLPDLGGLAGGLGGLFGGKH